MSKTNDYLLTYQESGKNPYGMKIPDYEEWLNTQEPTQEELEESFKEYENEDRRTTKAP